MIDIISRDDPVKFVNGRLNTYTNEIVNCGASIRRNFYQIAHILHTIDEDRLYIDDGFLSVVEYAEKTFKMKKTLIYNLLSVGEVYTGESGKESNLPHDGRKDYTSSQLKVILPYDEDEIRKLADENEITPFMTVSALKKKLKETFEGEEEPEEGEEDEEPSPDPEYIFEVKAYYDADGDFTVLTTGEMPEEIANAINAYLEEVSE